MQTFLSRLRSGRVLRRTVGVTCVAALAVTSAFVAGALAGDDRAPEVRSQPWAGTTSSGTETVAVPVLAPAWTGPDAPPPAPSEDADDMSETVRSEVTGLVDVPLPAAGDFADPETTASPANEPAPSPEATSADGGATGEAAGTASRTLLPLAPEVAAALADLAASTDPGAVPGVSVLDPGGDPCATNAGATGCPDGLRSTVLASTHLPPLHGYSLVRPPVGDADDRSGLVCPEATPEDGRVRFAVGTNLPVELEVQYWPEGQPEQVRRILTWTRDDQRDHFEANPPNPLGGPFFVLKHCMTLDGLEPGLVYEVHSIATTETGEEVRLTDRVRSDATGDRPPSRVVTLGQNIVFASLAHTPVEDAELVAYEVAPEDPLDCAVESLGTRVRLDRLSGPNTTEVGREELQRNGYGETFTRRTSAAFLAPEGSQVLVCLAALDDRRASFEGPAMSLESMVLSTPDRLMPVISWHRATLHAGQGIERVRVGIATNRAGRCAQLTRTPGPEETFEIEAPTGGMLCDRWDLDGSSGPNWGQPAVLWARVEGNGGSYTARAVLPVLGLGCDAGCVPPETEWYMLSLERPADQGALCGSSFGGCDEPTPRAAGSVLIRVAWEHGRRNGQRDWAAGPLTQQVGASGVADFPQLDTLRRPRYAPERDAIEVELRTDRPAEYRAELVGNCDRPAEETVLEGSTEGSTTLSFPDVCGGTRYAISVTLTDADGDTRVYGPDAVPPQRWDTTLRTPGHVATLGGSLAVHHGGIVDASSTVWLEPLSLTVEGVQLLPADYRDGYCGYRDLTVVHLNMPEVDLPDLVHVQGEVTVRDGGGTADTSRVNQPCPARSEPGGESRTVVVDAMVPLDSLRSGTVQVSADDATGAVEALITLRLIY